MPVIIDTPGPNEELSKAMIPEIEDLAVRLLDVATSTNC
jgi:hypothetical protein